MPATALWLAGSELPQRMSLRSMPGISGMSSPRSSARPRGRRTTSRGSTIRAMRRNRMRQTTGRTTGWPPGSSGWIGVCHRAPAGSVRMPGEAPAKEHTGLLVAPLYSARELPWDWRALPGGFRTSAGRFQGPEDAIRVGSRWVPEWIWPRSSRLPSHLGSESSAGLPSPQPT